MARLIKETPILYGAEARQFEMRMMNPEPVSQERQESIDRDYDFMRTRCVNCSFQTMNKNSIRLRRLGENDVVFILNKDFFLCRKKMRALIQDFFTLTQRV